MGSADRDSLTASSGVRLAANVLLVAAGYYVAGLIGLLLGLPPIRVSSANAVLFAVLLLARPRTWWLFLLAALPGHFLNAAYFGPVDVPQAIIVSHFLVGAFQAVTGALAVRPLLGTPPQLDTLRRTAGFVFLGAIAAPAISSLPTSFVFVRTGMEHFWATWRVRFLSNTFMILTLTPLIIQMMAVTKDTWASRPFRRYAEFGLLMIGLGAVAAFVFGTKFGTKGPAPNIYPALFYGPLPLLLWAATRFGLRTLCVSLLMIAILSVAYTSAGRGPFVPGGPIDGVTQFQLYLLAISLPLIFLTTVLQERRQAEDRLRLREQDLRISEERYREVVDSQTDLVCRYLADGTLTFANEAFCRFFGHPREKIIGRKFLEFIPESARAAAIEFVAKWNKKRRHLDAEYEVIRPDGSLGWQHWVDYAIVGPDGQPMEFQGIGRDITDRKRAEEANQKLAHASRLAMVGELAAIIAHDLSQPLSATLHNATSAELMLEKLEQPSLKEFGEIVADIREDSRRASVSIHRMRALLRKQHLELQPLDVSEVITDALHMVSGEALRRRVQIQTECATRLPPVRGDRVHLQQVLLNLILNAMDAMDGTLEPERRLRIRVDKDGNGAVQVAVSDTGRGIPSDRLPRIFESFYTTKKEGMGLGLSIARSIVEAHAGRIWAENNPTGGTTFHFTLPIHEIRNAGLHTGK